MNWNDYEAVWKRQAPPVGATADVAVLRETFETRHRKLAATLAVRDWLEAAAGLLVAGFFAVLAIGLFQTGKIIWPLGLSFALTLGVTAVFIRERLRTRRLRPGADVPLLTKIDADLAELRHQQRLLDRIAVWYLGPLFAAILGVVATLYLNARPWEPMREPWFLGGFVAFQAAVVGFVWIVNRRAVQKQIVPRLAELEKLRRDLTGPDARGS